MELLFVPTIIFLVVVAPIWLNLHYRHKSKMAKGISESEISDIEQMLETIDKLADRVETLEEILGSEHPGWEKTTASKKQQES